MSSTPPPPREPAAPAETRPRTASSVTADAPLRDDVLQREQERFGGFKFGAAFFGWLTATGTAVLLTALVGAIGTGIGLGSGATVDDAADAAADNVAGRMARFSGVKQGIAVWIWAVVIAIAVAVAGAVAGSQWDILANLDSLPRIPVTPETFTIAGILTALVAAVVALIGAILG